MSGTDTPPTFQERVTDLLATLGPYQMTELDQVGDVLISNVQSIQSRFDSGHVTAPERPGLNSELATNVALLAILADAPPALLTTGAGAQAAQAFRDSTQTDGAVTDPAATLNRQAAGIEAGPGAGQGSQSAGVGTTDAPIEQGQTGITIARAQNDGPGVATAENREAPSATDSGTDKATVRSEGNDPEHAA